MAGIHERKETPGMDLVTKDNVRRAFGQPPIALFRCTQLVQQRRGFQRRSRRTRQNREGFDLARRDRAVELRRSEIENADQLAACHHGYGRCPSCFSHEFAKAMNGTASVSAARQLDSKGRIVRARAAIHSASASPAGHERAFQTFRAGSPRRCDAQLIYCSRATGWQLHRHRSVETPRSATFSRIVSKSGANAMAIPSSWIPTASCN